MILYLCVNTHDHTTTAPAIAPSLSDAQHALDTINPENIQNLRIHVLAEFNSLYDLFLLDINPNKSLPDFLYNRSAEVTPSATLQAERASSPSLDIIDYDTRS